MMLLRQILGKLSNFRIEKIIFRPPGEKGKSLTRRRRKKNQQVSDFFKVLRKIYYFTSRHYSVIKQKSDILKHDCIHNVYEFLLGKLVIVNKSTKRLMKIKNSEMKVLWHVVNIKSIQN